MTPEVFQTHLDFLKHHSYSVISAQQLAQQAARSSNPVVLTFDDGYENFYIEAFPRLVRAGFTAAVFVVTDWIGKRGYLSWHQIRQLHSSGMTIGSHTCSHPHLPELDLIRMETEIRCSKELLEQGLGAPVLLFCYPFGGFSAQAVDLVRNSGYKIAFTTNRGLGNTPQGLLALRRIRMTSTVNPIRLWAKCSGYYNLFRRPRPPH